VARYGPSTNRISNYCVVIDIYLGAFKGKGITIGVDRYPPIPFGIVNYIR
jgi:hypothetical protein